MNVAKFSYAYCVEREILRLLFGLLYSNGSIIFRVLQNLILNLINIIELILCTEFVQIFLNYKVSGFITFKEKHIFNHFFKNTT